jgi:maltose alpha-D-glucosyltransferase/alpha-amylase
LKLFRRLEAGPNPEVEILRWLSARGFDGIPPLAATLEYEQRGGMATTLALLLGFVPNQGTGWDRALEDARGYLRASDAKRRHRPHFAQAAATLGGRTANLHRALAADDGDPAFAPEMFSAVQAELMAKQLERDAARALGVLAGRMESLSGPTQRLAGRLLEAGARLAARIKDVAALPVGSMRTRVHGDYHLGQVLVVGTDFVVIDFEGEPARPLVERRAKFSPLKDVAGMLRSFAYASHMALSEAVEAHPNQHRELETRARVWEAAVSSAFLGSYRVAIDGRDLVPVEDRAFTDLLDAFLLEKALYELAYELASRPQWVGIPLTGLLHLIG